MFSFAQLIMDAFFGRGVAKKGAVWEASGKRARGGKFKCRIGAWSKPQPKVSKHRKYIRKQKRASRILWQRAGAR